MKCVPSFYPTPPPHFENIGPTISSWACGLCLFPKPALHITGCGHTRKLWKLEPRGAELMFPSQGVGVRSLSGPGGRLLLWPQETQPGSPSGSPFPLCGFHRSPLSSTSRGGLFGWLVSWKVRWVWAQPAQPLSAPGGAVGPSAPRSPTGPTLGFELRYAVESGLGCFSSFNLGWLRAPESPFLPK